MNSYFFVLTVILIILQCSGHSYCTSLKDDNARPTCTRACYLQLSDKKCWRKTFTFFTHAFLSDLTDYYQMIPQEVILPDLHKFEDKVIDTMLFHMSHRKIPGLNDTMLQIFEHVKLTTAVLQSQRSQSQIQTQQNNHVGQLVMKIMKKKKCPDEEVCKQNIKDRVDYYKKLTWTFGILSPITLVLGFCMHFFTNQKLKKYNWIKQQIANMIKMTLEIIHKQQQCENITLKREAESQNRTENEETECNIFRCIV